MRPHRQQPTRLPHPWTAAYQASPSMGFSRQEYWSGVPSPSLIYRAVSPKFTSSIQLLKSKTIISSCLFDTFIGRSHRLFNSICPQVNRASLTAQLVKNPPAGQETSVQFLGWEDPLEKEMANHSSTLAWKIPWTEKPGRLQSTGSQRAGHN